eukprot:s5085_g5.t1
MSKATRGHAGSASSKRGSQPPPPPPPLFPPGGTTPKRIPPPPPLPPPPPSPPQVESSPSPSPPSAAQTPAITLHADANGFRLSFRSVADFAEYSAVMAANLMHVRSNREAYAGMNDILDFQQAVNFQQFQPSRGEQTNQPAKRLRQLQAPPPEMPDPSIIRLLEICNKIPGTGQDRMGWQLSADQNFVFRLRPLLESYDELTNKALLRDHFEVEWSQDSNFYTIPELRGLEVRDEEGKLIPTEWSQDSNFYTIPELRGLEVRDEEGKLIPTWSASFDWASLYAMFASLRNVIVSSPGRMKSASEIPRKIPDSLELLVPDSMLKITSDYLLRLLRVPVSQLNMTALKLVSQAVAAADQTANVQPITLSSISSSCKCLCLRFGHFADKLVRSEAIKTGVTKLYVAVQHNSGRSSVNSHGGDNQTVVLGLPGQHLGPTSVFLCKSSPP